MRHFYSCDASDPALYHLVIDSTALSAEAVVEVIVGRGALRFVGALEGLRGYAALLMVVYHAWVLTGGPLLGGGRAVLSGGFLAVDLFFVLSAFVLTLPAARSGDFGSWRDYALRRAARIVPAYYAALAIALVLFHPLAGPAADRRPPTADALLAAPDLPAGRGAAASPATTARSASASTRRCGRCRSRSPSTPCCRWSSLGFLRRPVLWLLVAVAATVALRALALGLADGSTRGPPALAAADVRRRLRRGDGGRVALRARGHDPRLDGAGAVRRRGRGAVGVGRADRRRRPARRAPVAVAGGGDPRRVRRARADRRRRRRALGRQPASRAGSARSPSASSSFTSW